MFTKTKMVSELRSVVHKLLLHHVIYDTLFPIPYGLCRSRHQPGGEGEAYGPCFVKTAIIANTFSMNFKQGRVELFSGHNRRCGKSHPKKVIPQRGWTLAGDRDPGCQYLTVLGRSY